jgi:uncharacterized membrane protein
MLADVTRTTALLTVGALLLAAVLAITVGSSSMQVAGFIVLAIVLMILIPDLVAPRTNLLRGGGRPRFFRTRNPRR